MRIHISTVLALTLLAISVGDASAQRRRGHRPPPRPPAPAPAPTPAPAPAPAPDEAADDSGDGAAPTAPTTPAPPPVTTAPTAPPPATTPAPASDADPDLDVDALRQEYLSLRDELFASRARAATVASALYSSRLEVHLTFANPRFHGVTRSAIRLDGASVYDDDRGAIASDDAVRFEGWIAPGRHQLVFRVEAVGVEDDRFTSATESSIVVLAVPGKDLRVVAKARDDGDIAYAWKKGEKGSYKLALGVDVKTIARPGAVPAKAEAPHAK